MATVCRLCMDESDTLTDIFQAKSLTTKEPSLLEMLTECIACKVDKDDALPKKICKSCVDACKNAFRFKRISEQSYDLFMELLAEPKPSCSSSSSSSSTRQPPQVDLRIVKVENIKAFDEVEDGPLDDDDDDFVLPAEDEDLVLPAKSTTIKLPSLAIKSVESINKTVSAKPQITMKWCGGTTIPLDKSTKLSGKIYKCRECSKEYLDLDKLHKHLKTHKEVLTPFRCRYCEEKFAKRSYLNAHIRIHTVKPYKCSYCLKGFARKQNRDEHVSLHTGVRPYKCTECLKEFRSNLGFKKHICLPAHNELRNAHLYIKAPSPQ